MHLSYRSLFLFAACLALTGCQAVAPAGVGDAATDTVRGDGANAPCVVDGTTIPRGGSGVAHCPGSTATIGCTCSSDGTVECEPACPLTDAAVDSGTDAAAHACTVPTGGLFAAAPGSPFSYSSVDPYPLSIVADDFDGDGHLDVGIVSFSASSDDVPTGGAVSTFLGNGSGRFSSAIGGGMPLTFGPSGAALGRFTGAAHADLVVTGADGTAGILVGTGADSFTVMPRIPIVGGTVVGAPVVADYDGDGNLDVAILTDDDSALTYTLSVLLGDGAGHLSHAPGAPVTPTTNTYQTADILTAGDFTGDGRIDLAWVVGVASTGPVGYRNAVTVLPGDGTGTFSMATAVSTRVDLGQREFLFDVRAGDFDGDGNLDLITANGNSLSISLLLGDGHGAFADAPNSPFQSSHSTYQVNAVAAADFNGDGSLDVAVASSDLGPLSVFLGDGHGGLTEMPGADPEFGFEPQGMVTGDFTGDGRPDVAVLGTTAFAVFLDQCSGVSM